MTTRKKVTMPESHKISLWIEANKERLSHLTVAEIAVRANRELDLSVNESSYRSRLRGAGIKWKIARTTPPSKEATVNTSTIRTNLESLGRAILHIYEEFGMTPQGPALERIARRVYKSKE
jgi:transposase